MRRGERTMAGGRRLWLVAALLGVAGCAEATFSAHSRDNNPDDIRRALAASHAPAHGKPMAFLVTTGPDKQLVGFDLEAGKIVWKEPVEVRSRVVVGPGWIAVKQGESELVARDAATGRVLFSTRLASGERFVGATLDDERLYYVAQATSQQRTSVVVAVDRTGHELWRAPTTGSLGAPAARGGVVAVPGLRQHLSLLDGKTGTELARVRSTDETITFVRAEPDGFVYGGNTGVYWLDGKSASGTREGSTYVSAKFGGDSGAQIRTFYYWDGYELAQADYSAFDRNRLLWRAEPRAGALGFTLDQAILYSYRYLFAFDARDGKLKWAYAHPRVDVVAADAVGPAIVFASADGVVGALDAQTGAPKEKHETGLRLAGASFGADGFAGGAAQAGGADQGAMLKTLEQIVWDHDARFTAVKVFAVSSIGELKQPEATQALLKIVLKDAGVQAQVQKRAADLLVARRDKQAVPLYLDALKLHYDYLADRRPHGVDVLARALAQLDVKEAAQELGAHLLDPATPHGQLKELAAALAGLAQAGSGKEAVRPLQELLLTYRADPMFLADPSPLTIAAEALSTSGGAEGRRTVAYVADEPRTISPLKRYLHEGRKK